MSTKPSRNDPCPCGSGKKFKHCCEGKVQPKSAAPSTAEFNQLVALYNAGHYAELESRTRVLVEQFPASAFAWKLLGGALLMQGKEALHAFQKTAELMPGDAEAHYNLAVALKGLGRLDEAATSYRSALKIKPNYAEALGNLGNVQKDLGQLDAAVESYRRALQINPGFAETHYCLGNALSDLGRFDEAIASYRIALKIKPNSVDTHYRLGNALSNIERFTDAVASYRNALVIDPDFAAAHNNMGNALGIMGQFSDAITSYRHALKIQPDFADPYNNIGNALSSLTQLDDAAESYRQALKVRPDFADAYSNLLFSLNYSTHHSPADCLAEARQYGQMVAGKVTSQFGSWQCEANPKRLRVGIVSGDFCAHPVGYFLENLVKHIDPARIELMAYSTQHMEDALTARIKPHFSAWHSLVGLSDQSAAQLIHADGVHVLIDLAGHTAHNRLPAFAWKPAPVQTTWLGYFATTGVTEMDYILGDKWTLPDEEAHHFVEKGWRLSGAHSCYTAPMEDSKVEPLPALHNQPITFGTLNNPTKMNDRVVACWAKILSAIPNSRLYLNTQNLRDNALKKSIIERYAAQGIPEDRLILEATTGRAAALNSYNKIDIALDPFPYPGGTTSYEALWMGVPILTMKGRNYISHLGESIMHNAGLPDWIAENEDDYVAKAVMFASDLPRLAALRAGLRQQVLASPLFDAPRFARSFEDALWGMWQSHRTN